MSQLSLCICVIPFISSSRVPLHLPLHLPLQLFKISASCFLPPVPRPMAGITAPGRAALRNATFGTLAIAPHTKYTAASTQSRHMMVGAVEVQSEKKERGSREGEVGKCVTVFGASSAPGQIWPLFFPQGHLHSLPYRLRIATHICPPTQMSDGCDTVQCLDVNNCRLVFVFFDPSPHFISPSFSLFLFSLFFFFSSSFSSLLSHYLSFPCLSLSFLALELLHLFFFLSLSFLFLLSLPSPPCLTLPTPFCPSSIYCSDEYKGTAAAYEGLASPAG